MKIVQKYQRTSKKKKWNCMKIGIHPTLPNLLEKVWQNELNQPDSNIPKYIYSKFELFSNWPKFFTMKSMIEDTIRPQIGFKFCSFGFVIVHLWIEPEFLTLMSRPELTQNLGQPVWVSSKMGSVLGAHLETFFYGIIRRQTVCKI